MGEGGGGRGGGGEGEEGGRVSVWGRVDGAVEGREVGGGEREGRREEVGGRRGPSSEGLGGCADWAADQSLVAVIGNRSAGKEQHVCSTTATQDGGSLPFPPIPSASVAGRTMRIGLPAARDAAPCAG